MLGKICYSMRVNPTQSERNMAKTECLSVEDFEKQSAEKSQKVAKA